MTAQPKEKHADYVREWYRALRKKNPYWSIERNARQRAEVIYRLGGRCNQCGITDIRVLEVHHVNHDGYKEREKHRGESAGKQLTSVRRTPEHFELLCSNCHKIKTLEFIYGKYRKSQS